jgi:flagellar biosynthetic protein FlhB
MEEVKQENKNAEGDPHVKGQIRQKQMAMARNRQMADVPTADVVLVNPTHVAVALRYDPMKGAPRIVAKGSGVIAAKIRELAAEHRIPMVQDVPLARALFAGCEVGQEIPAEFYGAVAKVLAFVMSLKARGSAAGLHRNPNPTTAAAA